MARGDNNTWGAAPAPPAQPGQGGQSGPYTQGPSIQTGVYQKQLDSLNQAGPGAGESYYSDNKGVWGSPSGGEVNNWGLVNNYSNPGNRPATSTNTNDWFSQYQSNMPSIDSEPGFGAYYDNAKNRAAESINQAMAARGAYGSSAANDQTARAFTDLEADRAKNEANYNLQRLGEQRGWQGLGGQLAGQADQNNLARNQNEQQWASLLSSLGLDASRLGLQRTNAGMDAASNAQNLQRNRGNDYFSQQLQLGDRMSGILAQGLYPAVDNDGAFVDKLAAGGVAEGNSRAANERQNFKDTLDLGATGYDIFDKYSR